MIKRILIIEDTPTIAIVQKHIAQKAGFHVDIAESLSEAEQLIAQHEYFCAIVDFVLPDAEKGEAIPATVNAGISTIVMTGNLDDETRNTVEKYPIIDYITKENKQAYHYLEKQLKRLPRNANVKVLVVDDSKTARMHISQLLVSHKYQTLEAPDGVAALAVLEQHPDIAVVITDNEMPHMNGSELCSEIRINYSYEEKAIIGISASDTPHLSTKFLKSGANDYLRKPFNSEEFYCRLSQNVDMLEQIKTIRLQANTDYLTKLPNRRYFFEEATTSLNHLEKQTAKASLAMIDIDHFKSINDNYGHDAGDEVLKGLSTCLQKYFDDYLVARLGGEEFAVYFADEQPSKVAQRLEKFRHFVETHSPEFSKDKIAFTLSIGAVNGSLYQLDKLIKQADINLYQAKESGRNQVVIA